MADLNTLARQLVEHPRWTWQSGMVGYTATGYREPILALLHGPHPSLTLDLEHPATKGWLLHMLREAHGAAFAKDEPWVEHREHGGQSDWLVTASTWPASRMHIANAATEGEALAAALLAVWWNGGAS